MHINLKQHVFILYQWLYFPKRKNCLANKPNVRLSPCILPVFPTCTLFVTVFPSVFLISDICVCARKDLWMFCWTVDSPKPTTLEETNPMINLLLQIKGSRLSKELEKRMCKWTGFSFLQLPLSFSKTSPKLVPHFWRGIFGNRRKPIVVRRTDAGDSHNKGTLVPSSWLHSINRIDR